MKLMDFLDRVSADYEVTEHTATFTSQQLAAEEHIPGLMVAKPVIVAADEEYYMCVLPACFKVDLNALKNQLGAKEVKLAQERDIAALFGDCEIGAEPPFGSLYGLTTIIDKSLTQDDHIVFQAGSHEKAIRMDMDDYRRLVSPKVLEFCYHMV